MHSEEYIKYLQSDTWKLKRLSKIQSVGYKCESCGITNVLLQVHHLTYENLGHEKMSELKVVCKNCHPKEDEIRKIESARLSYAKAVNTFARKKHGENWDDWMEWEQVEEEFDQWQERKDSSYDLF